MRTLTLAGSLRVVALLVASTLGMVGFIGKALGAPTGKPVVYAITPNNTITVIDTGSQAVLNTFTVAGGASYIVATPDGKQLYATGEDPIANPDGESVVWVIDTQTGEVKTTIPMDLFPAGMAVSSDGTRLYVATQFSDQTTGDVTVIDTATNTKVAETDTSEPWPMHIALSPDAKRVYVPNYGGKQQFGSLDVFDAATDTLLTSLTIGTYTNQYSWVAVSPDSSKVYATDIWMNADLETYGGGVYIYDAATLANPKAASVPGGTTLQVPLPNSSTLYGKNAGSILAYNTQADTVAATIPVATTVSDLALTPDGTQLYVSNSNAQSIAIINTATNTVSGSVAVAGATGLTIAAAPASTVLTPPIPTLRLSPTSVPPGSLATLTWTSTGATSCATSGAWTTGSVALQGVAQVSFAQPGSDILTLTCTGPGGSAAASATLTVVPGTTLTASATDVPVGSTVVLSWKGFAGATECNAASTWAGNLPASGSQVIGPLSTPGTYTFKLTCDGLSGGDSASRSISVYTPGALKFANMALANDNVYALAVPGTAVPAGGLDGHGYAYDSQELALPLTALGQTFAIGNGSKPTGISNQAVALTAAQLSNLTLLATAVNANQLNQPFVVTYTDGSTQTYTQSLSQWGRFMNYPGETQAVTITDRLTSTGAKQAGPWSIYAYTIPIDPTKVAKSLQLPKNRDVIVLAINETRAPTATPELLISAFNISGLASVGHVAVNGRLDNHGYAYDASLLPTGFSGLGQKFSIGPADQPDAVSNSTITLPAKSRYGLTVLGTGTNLQQVNQTFLVTYSDGTTTAFTQSVSDWGAPQKYPGESIAASTAYRITPTGTRQAGTWNVYAYTLQTDPGKQVVSLTLPKNRDVAVLAVNTLVAQ